MVTSTDVYLATYTYGFDQREYLERCEDRKSYNYLVGLGLLLFPVTHPPRREGLVLVSLPSRVQICIIYYCDLNPTLQPLQRNNGCSIVYLSRTLYLVTRVDIINAYCYTSLLDNRYVHNTIDVAMAWGN